jgi:hypothetical protein
MLNPKVHLLIFLFGILLIVAPTYAQAPVETNPSPANTAIAQVRVTATPVRVQLPTQSAPATEIAIATPTPTFTPTEIGPLLIEIPEDISEINVRELPEPDAQQLGLVRASERYVVTGRYFSWLRIDFEASPTGEGWIFGQLVTVLGDEAQIPDIDPYNTSEDSVIIEAETLDGTPVEDIDAQAVNATPTVDERQIVIPTAGQGETLSTSGGNQLPTFTPPPESVIRNNNIAAENVVLSDAETAGVTEQAITDLIDTGLPPIIPMLLLGGFGLLGMTVVILRR